MKKIYKYLQWQSLEDALTTMINRFPLAVFAHAALAIVLIASINDYALFTETLVAKSTLLALFTVWLSVGFQLGAESFNLQTKQRVFGQITVAVLALLYLMSLPADLSYVARDFIVLQLVIHGMLALAVFSIKSWGEWRAGQYSDTRWYAFMFNVLFYFLQAFVVGLLVFALGSLLLFTIETLLNPLWIQGELYAEWAVVSFVLLAPFFFFSQIPLALPRQLVLSEKFVHFLIRYIALPFIVLYFGILYLYSLKVIVGTGWPQGEVAWIVMWFAFFSYMVYILSHHLAHEPWVQTMRKLIPLLLLPQIAMLFYSIAVRIEEYGWTINRYLVVALGVWLVFMSLYHLWKLRSSPKLIVIPTSLVIALLLMLIGPWNMFGVAEQSQLGILEAELREVGVITEDGTVRSLASAERENLSQEQIETINSAVRYLCNYHGCESLKALLPVQYQVAQSEGEYPYERTSIIIEELNIPLYVDTSPEFEKNIMVSDSAYLARVDVSRANTMMEFSSYQDTQLASYAYYDIATGELLIYSDNEAQARIDMQAKLLTLLDERGLSGGMSQAGESNSAKPLVVTVSHEGQTYTLYLEHLSGTRESEEELEVDYIHGVVLY